MLIKSGRNNYTVKEGDRFFDNAACVQFMPIDNSKLPFGGYRTVTSVIIAKKEWARILRVSNFRMASKIGGTSYYYEGPK